MVSSAVLSVSELTDFGLITNAFQAFQQILEFSDIPDASSPSHMIMFPASYSHTLRSTQIYSVLFDTVTMNRDFAPCAMEILTLILSGNWTRHALPQEVLALCVERIGGVLNTETRGDLPPYHVSRLLFRLALQLGPMFLGGELASPFLGVVLSYSQLCFAMFQEEPCATEFILRFWGQVAGWRSGNRRDALHPLLVQFMPQVFQTFVEVFLNDIRERPGDWEISLHTLSNDHFALLHPISDPVHADACEWVVGLISERPFLELAFIIKVATAMLRARKPIGQATAEERRGVETELIQTIMALIDETTNQVSELLVENPGPVLQFGISLVEFMRGYQEVRLGEVVPTTAGDAFDELVTMNREIVDRFVRRMMVILASPGSNVQIVQAILGVILSMLKKPTLLEMTKQTPLISAIINRQLVIEFDHLPLEETKRLRSSLQQIYASLVDEVRLGEFLASYDARFDEPLTEVLAFRLYRDLKGLFKGIETDDQYAKVLTWFAERHFDHTLEVIRQFAHEESVVRAVCQLWISMFPDRIIKGPGRPQKFTQTGGFGIRLFKASLAIIGRIQAIGIHDVAKMPVLMKVISFCLTTESVNFGVMAYYRDDSLEKMVAIFDSQVRRVEFGQIAGQSKLLLNILRSYAAVIRLTGIGNQECVMSAIHFLWNCMNDEQDDRITGELWKGAANVLRKILELAAADPEAYGAVFQECRRIFLIVVWALGTPSRVKIAQQFAPLVLSQWLHDTDFVRETVETIFQEFDAPFQGQIRKAFDDVFANCQLPLTKQMSERFAKNQVYAFTSVIRKYRINFPSLEGLIRPL
jgi:hypothetical protein